jgi:hypothetical protein
MIILRADGAAAIDAISAVLQRSGRLSAKSSKLLKNLLWHGGNSMVYPSRTTGEHRAGCSKWPSSKAAASEEAKAYASVC